MESRSESEVPRKQAIGDEQGSSSTCTHFSLSKNQNALWTDTGREINLGHVQLGIDAIDLFFRGVGANSSNSAPSNL